MPSIAERLKVASPSVFFVLGSVIATAFYFSYGSSAESLKPKIAQAREALKKSELKLKETQEKAQNKAKFQEEMEKVSQTLYYALQYLPKELDTQDLLRKIYSEARTAGVELSNFKPKELVSKDFYEELPMEIQIRGTFSQLVTFLANISKIPRIVNIRNVHIAKPDFIDGYPIMRMTGVLVGYRYKEGK